MVDFNRGYTAQAAIEAARRMEEAGLLWIEEPVLPEDVPGYQALRAWYNGGRRRRSARQPGGIPRIFCR